MPAEGYSASQGTVTQAERASSNPTVITCLAEKKLSHDLYIIPSADADEQA